MTVKPGQCRAVGQIDIQIHHMAIFRQAAVDRGQQVFATRSGKGRERNAVRLAGNPVSNAGPFLRIQQIQLVQRFNRSRLFQAQFGQHILDVSFLRLAVGRGDIAYMYDEIGFRNLFQGRLKGGYKLGRQFGNEPDRIGQDDIAARRQRKRPHCRIQRCEQHVARHYLCIGEPVEQRRLARIGVTHERHHRIGNPLAGVAMKRPGSLDFVQLAPQPRDPLADQPPVDFQLAFTRAADETKTAALAL